MYAIGLKFYDFFERAVVGDAECPGTTKERKGKLSREKTRILTTY